MNKLMGPDGALSQPQRSSYLANNLPEHDKLLNQIGNVKPGQFEQSVAGGVKALNNVPSRQYFNNAGIAGSQASINASPYQAKNDGGMIEDAHDEDEFWYQTPADGG